MLVAGLTLLPALLAIFGRAVFWPTQVRRGRGERELGAQVAGRVIPRPAHTLVVGVLVFGGLAFVAALLPLGIRGRDRGSERERRGSRQRGARSTSPRRARTRPTSSSSSPSRCGTTPALSWPRRRCRRGPLHTLPGRSIPNGTPIPPAALRAACTRSSGIPRCSRRCRPPARPERRCRRRHTTPTGRRRVSSARTGTRSSSRQRSRPASSLDTGAQRGARHPQRLDGGPAQRRRGRERRRRRGPGALRRQLTSDSDLIHIVPVAIIAIALLLALVLRSLVAPLYLIVSVVFSYLAALGLSSLVFIDIAGSGGLTFLLPFLMFIFLLALGEDYNILVMTRIREEAHRARLREAVVRAVGAPGPTVTSAGLVLAGTFGVLAVIAGGSRAGSQVRDIGFGLAIGILMDTFLVRSLLVPSTVSLLGRWNWWPGKLAEMDLAVPAALDAGDPGKPVLDEPSKASPIPELADCPPSRLAD